MIPPLTTDYLLDGKDRSFRVGAHNMLKNSSLSEKWLLIIFYSHSPHHYIATWPGVEDTPQGPPYAGGHAQILRAEQI